MGWGDSASVVVLENFTAPVFSGKHYHQHILACNLASFIIVQCWLNAYGAFLRYLERVVVFQGSITHGGQGRENLKSFWHKLTRILLNMKNITWAGFGMFSSWPRGHGGGNMPGRQDYHLGELGSALPASVLVRVCPYILCSPPRLVAGTWVGSASAHRPSMEPRDGTKKVDQKLGLGLFGSFFPHFHFGVRAGGVGSRLTAGLALPDEREHCHRGEEHPRLDWIGFTTFTWRAGRVLTSPRQHSTGSRLRL